MVKFREPLIYRACNKFWECLKDLWYLQQSFQPSAAQSPAGSFDEGLENKGGNKDMACGECEGKAQEYTVSKLSSIILA